MKDALFVGMRLHHYQYWIRLCWMILLVATPSATKALSTTPTDQPQQKIPPVSGVPKAPYIPPSITNLDPTIAIPERFVDFANEYFGRLLRRANPAAEKANKYDWVEDVFSTSNDDGATFSLLSWNVLAQSLYEKGKMSSTTTTTTNTHNDVLPWSTRLEWILQWLQKSNADIICLQEVDNEKVFARDVLPALQSFGYQGVLQQGGSFNKQVKEIKRRKSKGERAHFVATFWKTSLFQEIPLTQDGSPAAHMARSRTLTSLLRHKDNNAVLAIVNCHLEGHPQQYAARIQQLQHALDDLAKRVEGVVPHGLVLAGDFNCELASSACSTYLRMGRVGRKGGLGGVHGSAALAMPPAILESEEATKVLNPILEWGQALPNKEMESVKPHAFRRNSMASAYPPQIPVTLQFTYCARPFRPVSGLDQIWYSSRTLERKALRRAVRPTARNIILQTGLPQAILQQPSDHLPVGAVFGWSDCTKDKEDYNLQQPHNEGLQELIVVPDQPTPRPKPLSPIMAYAELDLLLSTCPWDSPQQKQQLETILEHKLPAKEEKPSDEEIKRLRIIRDDRKRLLEKASESVRPILHRILKLKKEVSNYEEEMCAG